MPPLVKPKHEHDVIIGLVVLTKVIGICSQCLVVRVDSSWKLSASIPFARDDMQSFDSIRYPW